MPDSSKCSSNYKGHICVKPLGHGPGHRCFCSLVWTAKPTSKKDKKNGT